MAIKIYREKYNRKYQNALFGIVWNPKTCQKKLGTVLWQSDVKSKYHYFVFKFQMLRHQNSTVMEMPMNPGEDKRRMKILQTEMRKINLVNHPLVIKR